MTDVFRPCVLPKGKWHSTLDFVRPCVLSKGGDGMSRPTLFDRVRCPKEVMSCHARRLSTVCVDQRRCWHTTPDVVRPCVLPKRDVGMPRPTWFDRLCFPKAMKACHARRSSTVCAAQRRRWHAMPEAVRPFVLPKGDDGMPCPASFDRVCCQKAMMACHTRRRSIVFADHGL